MRRVCAVASAALVMALTLAAASAPPAGGHTAGPPPVPVTPPTSVEEIPAGDEERYRSHVTGTSPPIPGLDARILGGQEKLQITWTGETPLIILGAQGEPMIRMSNAGIDLNENAPSAYLSAERYAQVPLPATASASAPPSWRRLEDAGAISWFEHRAQWMTAERPKIVGDGGRALTIFHWKVAALLGDRRVHIEGVLDWLPDPDAIRAGQSEGSNSLLSAAILLGAMSVGALAGVGVRRRLDEPGVK